MIEIKREYIKNAWLVLGSFFLLTAFCSIMDDNALMEGLFYLVLGVGVLIYRYFKYRFDDPVPHEFARNVLLLIGWFFLISTIGNIMMKVWLGALICALICFVVFYIRNNKYGIEEN